MTSGKLTLAATSVAFGLVASALYAPAAMAQSAAAKTEPAAVEPQSGLAVEKWMDLMESALNLQALKGQSNVMIGNPGNTPLIVKCGSYYLVGPEDKVYSSVKGNPTTIPPWSVAYVRTNKFNKWCSDGVRGYNVNETKYLVGKIPVNGSFDDSTLIWLTGQWQR